MTQEEARAAMDRLDGMTRTRIVALFNGERDLERRRRQVDRQRASLARDGIEAGPLLEALRILRPDEGREA